MQQLLIRSHVSHVSTLLYQCTVTHTHNTAYTMLVYVTLFCINSSTFFFAVDCTSLFKSAEAFASISIIMRKHAPVNVLTFSQHTMSSQSLSVFCMQTLLSELRSRSLLRSVPCFMSVLVVVSHRILRLFGHTSSSVGPYLNYIRSKQ